MSERDLTNFLTATAEAFPDVRFFNFRWLRKERRLKVREIPRDPPMLPAGPTWETKIDMFFVGPAGQPKILAVNTSEATDVVESLPRLRASISPGRFVGRVWEELGREITQGYGGVLNTNHHADDPDGKRIIDKLFRIHRKLAEKRLVIVDLVTGAVVGEDEGYGWYGADAARECLANKDRFIQVRYSPDNGIFWGYKPAKVPGE